MIRLKLCLQNCLRLEDYPRPHILKRVRHLSYLRDCYGAFDKFKSLSGLEYLRALIPEAIQGNMKDKKHLEELSLSWSGINADDSQIERENLDKLKPDKNIKKLEINGYRGTKFPDWFGDHSFCNLVSLNLRKCRDCDSLPAVGQLPSLKHLSISGMHRILQLTREFYWNVSSVPPFRALANLVFKQMPELIE
ncbi:putative disease resistance RPP13-like protein 1 [Solanum pennellii]|uniref:Disease resistance RPP13-like protein 1 n=1 Tax=Solanum pennellii TaxID=28526 RepID=A0ABM1VH70_SOLPN|nr:putative disease resistance RPP13-like protein 1 [Solanum pennellii]